MESAGGVPAMARWGLAFLAAACLWLDPSSGVATAILFGAGLYGLWHFRVTLAAWRNPTGILFGLGVLWALLSWTWSFNPSGTARDLIKSLPLVMGVWAIPAIFNRPGRIWLVLLASAGFVTARLGADIVRLVSELGWPTVLTEARYFRPYVYTHPNVTSMMAGLCALIFLSRGLAGVRGWGRKALLAAGFLVDLAYLAMMASRGPQLVFALSLLVFPVLALPGWRARSVAALLAIGIGAGLWHMAPTLNPRFSDSTAGNFNRRDTIWGHSKLLADLRPVAGYGFGKKAFHKAVYENPEQRAPLVPVTYPHAHSYWLMLYFQGGKVAFAVWSLAWALLGFRLIRRASGFEQQAEGWWARLQARVLPVLLLVGGAAILLYGAADFPDHVLRHTQFYLAGLAVALTCPSAPEGRSGA